MNNKTSSNMKTHLLLEEIIQFKRTITKKKESQKLKKNKITKVKN